MPLSRVFGLNISLRFETSNNGLSARAEFISCKHSYGYVCRVPRRSFFSPFRFLYQQTTAGSWPLGNVSWKKTHESLDTEIRRINCEKCQIQCFSQEKCVSYNCGKNTCELSSSDHVLRPTNLVSAEGMVYHASQVSKRWRWMNNYGLTRS